MNNKPLLKQSQNSFFRQLFFIVGLIAIGFIIWNQLAFFMSCFLGSITIYVVLRKPLFYFTEKKHWKSWQAATLLIAATTFVLLGIGFLIFEVVATEISSVDISNIVTQIQHFFKKATIYIEHPIVPEDISIQAKKFLTGLAKGIISTTYNFVFNLFMMMIVLYFMLANGRKMEKIATKYIPFSGESLAMIKREVKSMIFSNAVGLPVIMIVQGFTAALGYWLFGFSDVAFWAFLTAVFGLLPVVGTAGIWLPLSISLLATGNIWQGVVLILYGVFIISNADNGCRLVLMKKMANTHPLIVIFGVILGIPLFGFWGLIFGPLLLSGFLLLIKIYYMEYNQKKNIPQNESATLPAESKNIPTT